MQAREEGMQRAREGRGRKRAGEGGGETARGNGSDGCLSRSCSLVPRFRMSVRRVVPASA
eukprot:3882792-Rhodomonas_salina.3